MTRLQLEGVHERMGASFVEDLGFLVPGHYGDPDAEQRRVHRSVGLLDSSHRGVLDLRGKDVRGFLHGMVPSPARELTTTRGQRSCFLTPKGRIVELFDLHLLADGTGRLVLASPLRTALVEALGKYAFLSDVSLVDRGDDLAVLSVEGAESVGLLRRLCGVENVPLGQLERRDAELGGSRVTVVRRGESPEGGFDLWVPRAVLESVWQALGDAVVGAGGGMIGLEASEALRIESGIPRSGKDCDDESFLAEVGLDALASIDKCYVGQEVVSRMRTYGHANWKLRGVVRRGTERSAIRAGEELTVRGAQAGRIRSWARSVRLGSGVGLASIQRALWEATECRTAAGDRLELVALPIVPPLPVVDG